MRDGAPWDEPAVRLDAVERDWTDGLAGRWVTRADTPSGGRSVGVGSGGLCCWKRFCAAAVIAACEAWAMLAKASCCCFIIAAMNAWGSKLGGGGAAGAGAAAAGAGAGGGGGGGLRIWFALSMRLAYLVSVRWTRLVRR